MTWLRMRFLELLVLITLLALLAAAQVVQASGAPGRAGSQGAIANEIAPPSGSTSRTQFAAVCIERAGTSAR